MKQIEILKNEYKQAVKSSFYKLNEEELLEELKKENILNEQGFLYKKNENDTKYEVIPFEDAWIYYSAELDNEDLLMWINIFYKEELLAMHGFNNELYNLLLIKYKNIINKEVFDMLCDDPNGFVEGIFKYKNSSKLYDFLRKDNKYTDKNSWASDPGRLTLSDNKYQEIGKILNLDKKQLKIFNKDKVKIKEHIKYGDTQPAIVTSLNPLIISAYNDELDCVVLLKFPNELVEKYSLTIGDRLVTINLYHQKQVGFGYPKDVTPGEKNSNVFRDVIPVVGLFVSDDEGKCERKVQGVSKELWDRLQELTLVKLRENPNLTREGFEYLYSKK